MDSTICVIQTSEMKFNTLLSSLLPAALCECFDVFLSPFFVFLKNVANDKNKNQLFKKQIFYKPNTTFLKILSQIENQSKILSVLKRNKKKLSKICIVLSFLLYFSPKKKTKCRLTKYDRTSLVLVIVHIVDVVIVADTAANATANQWRHQWATRVSILSSHILMLLLVKKTLSGQTRTVRHIVRMRILPSTIPHQKLVNNTQKSTASWLERHAQAPTKNVSY